eukprot:snap_masked-scaffold_24-processed-gene-3.30-mRNA-1 protein AED:1.00 eAED:1.00 QI:0/-1/0/0/-1/1/1/0/386
MSDLTDYDEVSILSSANTPKLLKKLVLGSPKRSIFQPSGKQEITRLRTDEEKTPGSDNSKFKAIDKPKVKNKGRSWFNFYKKHSTLHEAVNPTDFRNETFVESVEAFESTKGEKISNYAPNCISVLDDERILALFSPKESIKRKAEVILKTNKKSLKGEIITKLEISRGVLKFFQDSINPILEIKVLDIKSLRYLGQKKKIFGLSAYSNNTQKIGHGHHLVKVTRVAMECGSEFEAKVWITVLLMELERVADSILACLQNMLNLYKANSFAEMNFPHTECLLRKRVHLYELAKLSESSKLNEAKFLLAEFLEEKGRSAEASKYYLAVEGYLTQKKIFGSDKFSMNNMLQSLRPMSEIGIIKQEIKLTWAKAKLTQQQIETEKKLNL